MRIPPLTTHNLDQVKAAHPPCVITLENRLAIQAFIILILSKAIDAMYVTITLQKMY